MGDFNHSIKTPDSSDEVDFNQIAHDISFSRWVVRDFQQKKKKRK